MINNKWRNIKKYSKLQKKFMNSEVEEAKN